MMLPTEEEQTEDLGETMNAMNNTTSTTRIVNLVNSGATLLSGDVDDCRTPDDSSCRAGLAAVLALARNYTDGEPLFVTQEFDKSSPFVNMHPLEWVVNRLVINNIFGINVMTSRPSIFLQNKVDSQVSQRDITGLQTTDMPVLISNVALPISNSWYPYNEAIHFDKETGLALMSMTNLADFSVSAVAATRGALNYIHSINTLNGCNSGTINSFETYVDENPYFDDLVQRNNATECWTSVILFADVADLYWEYLAAVSTDPLRPDLIINIEPTYRTFSSPQLYNGTDVWVSHCSMGSNSYCQHRIEVINDGSGRIANVEFFTEDIRRMPDDFKDETYGEHVTRLRYLADEAEEFNPVVGYTGFIPVHREGTFRRCQSGECPVGNLFTDAARWSTDADFAFATSGGFRGPGKPAGETRYTDIFAALPFPNNLCTGTMSGVNVFKLFNHSISVATFSSEVADGGDDLLQVSGARITYNTLLPGSRLVAIDMWDRDKNTYVPLDRLKLYTFATDSFLCGANDPYPILTGSNLVLEGEKPGVVGDVLHQTVVAEYLSSLDEPYDTSIQGRLFNNTNAFSVLNLVQTEDDCPPNTVWDEGTATCLDCPQYSFVTFSDERLDYQSSNNVLEKPTGRVLLVNRESFGVSVFPKAAPSWLTFTDATIDDRVVLGRPDLMTLNTGDSLILEFNVDSTKIGAGVDRSALGTVSFGVEDGGSYPGCTGRDATFDVLLRVTPEEQLNQLGGLRFAGYALAAIVILTAIASASWVHYYRQTRVVKVMQPLFLFTICFGVVILSAGMIALSIDDEIASVKTCSFVCMLTPWLLSTGFCMSFAALFSKLWRINRLFSDRQGFRRVVVQQKDVAAPFGALFALNVVILLIWTFVDPLKWRRLVINGEIWNTQGTCVGGNVTTIMTVLLALVDFSALFLACFQAYKARDISSEFSESKYIGIAVYGWLQILVIALPILFLMNEESASARYFLQVAVTFIICMSMLLIIFIPAFVNFKRQGSQSARRVTVTGIDTEALNNSHHGSVSSFRTSGTGRYSGSQPFATSNTNSNSAPGEKIGSLRLTPSAIEQIKGCVSSSEESSSSEDSDSDDDLESGGMIPGSANTVSSRVSVGSASSAISAARLKKRMIEETVTPRLTQGKDVKKGSGDDDDDDVGGQSSEKSTSDTDRMATDDSTGG